MVFNTGETSEELKEKYNFEGSVLREAQCRMLEMLKYLDEVCKSLMIEYRLSDGNVLGSIRHKGFIPWDDDMDIALERNDWIKLISYLKKNPHQQFVIQDHDTDPNYYGSWAVLRDLHSEYIIDSDIHKIRKYRGLQVDIFPFEKGNIMLFQRISSSFTWWNNRVNAKSRPLVAKFFYFFQFKLLYPFFRILTRLLRLLRKEDYFMHCYGAYWKDRFPVDVCKPYKPILFEGQLFPGPAKPYDYLKILYKNYMDLPPEDKRRIHKADYIIW